MFSLIFVKQLVWRMYPVHLKGVVVKTIIVGIYTALSWFRDILFTL